MSPTEEIAVNFLEMHTIVQQKESFDLKRQSCEVSDITVVDTSLSDENGKICKDTKILKN